MREGATKTAVACVILSFAGESAVRLFPTVRAEIVGREEVGDLRLFVIFFTQHDQGTEGCVDFEVGREAEDDPEEGVTRPDVTNG